MEENGFLLDPKIFQKIGIVNYISKIADAILFSHQAYNQIEPFLTKNIFANRINLGTEDAVLHNNEKVTDSMAKDEKFATLNLVIPADLDSLPHQLIND